MIYYLTELGRGTMDRSGNWSYLKGLCYSARIYNKGLTKEVEENYSATTAFHKYIIKIKIEQARNGLFFYIDIRIYNR